MVRLALYGACVIGAIYLVARIVHVATFLWFAATQKGRRQPLPPGFPGRKLFNARP